VSDANTSTVPMFPLGTTVFPGAQVPLHVFEDRYLALVGHLLSMPDPADRVFGTVAIREGWEVGEHGSQRLYRTGCLLQLTEVEHEEDGSLQVVALARERISLIGMETSGLYPRGRIESWPDPVEQVEEELCERARATFTAYRAAVAQFRGDPFSGTLPRDPEYLSWTLSALAPLPLPDRQELLSAETTRERLQLVVSLLRAELRAINVIPSLPATEVARTAWSPN